MHPIYSVALTRLKEFIRRPEAVFWVYFFPVLMVIVLGIAFRQSKEVFQINVVQGPHADAIISQLASNDQIKTLTVSEADGRRRLRTGKAVLSISAKNETIPNRSSIC